MSNLFLGHGLCNIGYLDLMEKFKICASLGVLAGLEKYLLFGHHPLSVTCSMEFLVLLRYFSTLELMSFTKQFYQVWSC